MAWPMTLAVSAALVAACGQPSPAAGPRIAATPEPGRDSLLPMGIEEALPHVSFPRMVFLTHAGDGTGRLFLVLQPGRVMAFTADPADGPPTVFLDIQDRVNDSSNEEGLLGLAFDPDFANSGLFYVSYTASGPPRSVVSRFSVLSDDPDRADLASEQVLLEVAQPFPNHNGGNIVYGPDGYLYLGLGDGGAAGDPFGNGQDPGTLLGAVLRIDPASTSDGRAYGIPSDNPFVGVEGARDEVWAYGLRNPWRFSFDRETGDLWVGDVGQNRFEEIDLVLPGRNYGWNAMEGFHCFPPSRSCSQGGPHAPPSGLAPPVVEYALADGNCSVIGGYAYRGLRLPTLHGAYVYADFCSGRVWALVLSGGGEVAQQALLVDTDMRISSFGEGPDGELYILSFGGAILRLQDRYS